MNTKIIFMRRALAEMEILGGDVFVELDGENKGLLATENLIITTTAGKHNIRIYKKNQTGSCGGEIKADVEVEEGRDLTVRYIEPHVGECSGHMIVSYFSSMEEIDKIVKQSEKQVRDEYAKELIKKANDEKKRPKNKVLAFMSAISFF